MKKTKPNKKEQPSVKFVFEQGILQKDFYIRNTRLNIRKLVGLFPISPNFIVINVFQKQESFLRAIHKKKIPDWLVAYVPKNSTSYIYILNREKKPSEKQIRNDHQVLLHEITHLYTNTLNPKLPDWLREGISVYIAAQIFKQKISVADWKKVALKDVPFKGMPWKIAVEHDGYTIAGLLVMFFVRKNGWKKFVTVLGNYDSGNHPVKSIFSLLDKRHVQFISDFKTQFVK